MPRRGFMGTISYSRHCGKQSFGQRKDLSSQIRTRREALGLTQQALADRMQTTQANVARWESWQYDNYTIRSLRAIASALRARLVVEIVPKEDES